MIIVFLVLILTVSLHAQEPYRPAPAPAVPITRLEYFIDSDPGIGNGIPIPITAAANIVNRDIQVSLDGINKGVHMLYVRSMNEQGSWSHLTTFFFDNFNLPSYSTAGSRPRLIACEYFIDSDPGPGNGVPVNITNDTSVNASLLVNLNGLSIGVHQLYVRTKDETGKWSLSNVVVFDNSTIEPYRPAPAALKPISALEYFIDTDPGFGMANSITVPASTDIIAFNADINISGIGEGQHVIYFRSKENPWSLTAYVPLQVGSVLPVTWLYVKAVALPGEALIQWGTGTEINSEKYVIEYSLDGDKFHEAGQVASKDQSNGANYSFTHKTERSGLHYYRIRQVDKDGKMNYSRVVQVFISKTGDEISVYPNPVSEVVNIRWSSGRTINRIQVVDAQGKLIKEVLGALLTDRPVSISLKGLPRGAYYIKLFDKRSAAIIYPVMKN